MNDSTTYFAAYENFVCWGCRICACNWTLRTPHFIDVNFTAILERHAELCTTELISVGIERVTTNGFTVYSQNQFNIGYMKMLDTQICPEYIRNNIISPVSKK
jgi:hypothetical protein